VSSYLLPNADDLAAARFDAFTELFNPGTFSHMERLGVASGWHCWEVGAGGASVVEWLAQRTGPAGRVVATDIDVSRMGPATSLPHVDVRVHDVALDEPPPGPFDLVHARLVLVHLPERARALANMMSVLRPGGWLLLEDADPALQPLACLEELGPEQALANRIRAAFRLLMSGRHVDLAYGRTLPRLLRAAGLDRVEAEAWFPVSHPACDRLEVATVNLVRDQLVAAGHCTDEEIRRHLENVVAGTLDLTQPPLVRAWGQRPQSSQLPGGMGE
jgi:SAM-dependent methyltransferase